MAVDNPKGDLRDPAEEKRVPLTTETVPAEKTTEVVRETVTETPARDVVTTED